jgi:dTDP-glucose 4,6-dehydratase
MSNEMPPLKQNFEIFSKNLRGKKILITGGTGFFGKNLVEIIDFGNKVYGWKTEVISLSRTGRVDESRPGIFQIKWDLEKPLLGFCPSCVDYIIHAASPLNNISIDGSQRVYQSMVGAMDNILNYASGAGVESFVFASSGAVYGPQTASQPPFGEDFQNSSIRNDPRYAYGNGKLSAELAGVEMGRRNGFRFVSARCFAFSGQYLPLDSHFAIGNFVRDLISKQPILVSGDPRTLRSYMDAEDLCFWLLKILFEGKSGEAYNVGSDQVVSIGELAELVSSFRPGCDVIFKMPQGELGDIVSAYVPNIDKAKVELGLDLKISLRDSVGRMI